MRALGVTRAFGYFGVICMLAPSLDCGSSVDSDPATATSELQAGNVLYETSTATVVQDGDWIRWRFRAPLGDGVETRLFRGTRTPDGGCSFSVTGESERTNTFPRILIVERTVAANINQCVAEVEHATLRGEAAISREQSRLTASARAGHDERTPEGADSGASLQLQAWWTWYAYLQTRLEDPVNADVNWLKSNIEWAANGNQCMTGWHRWTNCWWLSATGWTNDLCSDTGTAGGTLPCREVWHKSTAIYENGYFCAFWPTFVQYRWNELHAFTEGGWAWSTYSYSTEWSGGCYWLLSHEIDYRPW